MDLNPLLEPLVQYLVEKVSNRIKLDSNEEIKAQLERLEYAITELEEGKLDADNIDSKVSDAIDDYDFDSKVRECVDDLTFEVRVS